MLRVIPINLNSIISIYPHSKNITKDLHIHGRILHILKSSQVNGYSWVVWLFNNAITFNGYKCTMHTQTQSRWLPFTINLCVCRKLFVECITRQTTYGDLKAEYLWISSTCTENGHTHKHCT